MPICKRQKQPHRVVVRRKCSENMRQFYRRTPMSKCDFSKVALQLLERDKYTNKESYLTVSIFSTGRTKIIICSAVESKENPDLVGR